MEEKLEKAYSENQRPEVNSRDELNAWVDYKQARDSGSDHEAAMKHIAAQATKFAPTTQPTQPESETDRIYRRLAESCRQTATGREWA